MMYPLYATVIKEENLCFPMLGLKVLHFKVLLAGYKMEMGFKVRKVFKLKNEQIKAEYVFERYRWYKYGWSVEMLKWRSKELSQKLHYLEKFFKEEKRENI